MARFHINDGTRPGIRVERFKYQTTEPRGLGGKLGSSVLNEAQARKNGLLPDAPAAPIDWIGYWDFEDPDAVNLISGAPGSSFNVSTPGYGGYYTSPLNTDTPIRGTRSVMNDGGNTSSRFAYWTPSPFGTITFGARARNWFGMDIGPANADDGNYLAIRCAVKTTADVMYVKNVNAATPAVPELAGVAHIAIVYNPTTRQAKLYVNGAYRSSWSMPLVTHHTTIGCMGSYAANNQFDDAFIVNGELSLAQIAQLAAGNIPT